MNILLKNGYVLQHSTSSVTTDRLNLYISKGKIVGIGDAPPDFIADKTIEADNKLILPGLINSHTHAYMTLLRNAADDLAFDDWLFGNILPMEDRLTKEDGYWGSLLACMEMLRTGTTCFLDMHMFQDQTVRAAAKIGMRARVSRGLVGSAADVGTSSRIAEAFAEMDNYAKMGNYAKTGDYAEMGNYARTGGCARTDNNTDNDTDNDAEDRLITFALAPHAIYTCDNEFLKHVSDLAGQHHLSLNIHLSESRNEVDNCLAQHGVTPVRLLEQLDFFKVPTTAAHCVHVNEQDIAILKKHQVNVVTNPISNMKLGNGFAPIKEMMQAGVNICIGTDGAASNNTLNLFREMSGISLVQKGLHADACAMNALATFNLATINGAAALGAGDRLGSLAVGKSADLSIVDLKMPQLNPVTPDRMMSALIYSMNGAEVDSVIIGGRPVMENRKFTNIDEEEVYEHVNHIRNRIRN